MKFALPCILPYRIDIDGSPPDALDVLIDLGALDIEAGRGGLAAIFPDAVTKDKIAVALGLPDVRVSAARGRDNDSVWLLNPQSIRIGGLRLTNSQAFGTGHHPTTALCIEAIEELLSIEPVHRILDVGTGSGILALSALTMGVPQAIGLDTDTEAIKAAKENARLNQLADRLHLVAGAPDVVRGQWPIIAANILAAPLIEMAPTLVARLATRGRLILSGITCSLEREVRGAYRHFGVRHIDGKSRAGWSVLIAQSPW